MKTALVTGGSGYFGTLLINKLLKEGWKVKSFDINPPINKKNEFEFYKVDVRKINQHSKIFKNVDCIFHNVALVPLSKSKDFNATNLKGTKNVIEMAIKNDVKSFIHTSSSAIYGVPKKNPVDEHYLPNPQENYGISKLNSEILLSTYAKDININIIRPRTILGHGRLGIFQILFEWVSKGWNIPVLGSGKNIYQFVHADDLCEACILSFEMEGFNYFNIGSQNFCSMRETLEALCNFANKGSKVISLPINVMENLMHLSSRLGISPLGPYHALMYGNSLYFDTSKAEKELNWKSKYSNKEAIIDSYKYFLSYKNKLNNENISMSPHNSYLKQGILKSFGYLLNYF